jgi:hypothetical protein
MLRIAKLDTQTVDWSDLLACQYVIARFFHHLDGGDIAKAAAQFAPTGVWLRRGHALTGPEGLMAGLAERSKTVVVRHVIANPILEAAPDGEVAGKFVMTVYRDWDPEGRSPVPMDGPELVRDVSVRFTRVEGSWRIAHLTAKSIFQCRD